MAKNPKFLIELKRIAIKGIIITVKLLITSKNEIAVIEGLRYMIINNTCNKINNNNNNNKYYY